MMMKMIMLMMLIIMMVMSRDKHVQIKPVWWRLTISRMIARTWNVENDDEDQYDDTEENGSDHDDKN
jgi:hypothetical protein